MGRMRRFQQIELSVAVTEFFAAAGVIEVFPGGERVAPEIGFNDVALYPQKGDFSDQARIHGVETVMLLPGGVDP